MSHVDYYVSPYTDEVIDRATVERELRGAVHLARQALARAEQGGDVESIRVARSSLADRIKRARAEGVTPYAMRAKGER